MIKANSPHVRAKIKVRWRKRHQGENNTALLAAINSIMSLIGNRFVEDIYRRKRIKTNYFRIKYQKKEI